MSHLARPSAGSSGSRLLLVRPSGTRAASRTRQALVPQPTSGLHLGVIVAVGVIALVWLMGYLGYRLGFAGLIRVPDLIGEPGSGLATGAMIVIGIPRMVVSAGLEHPIALFLGFTAIAIPAGALGAARPTVPGGPRHKPAVTLIANIGATAAMLAGAGLIWWTSSPARLDLLQALPADPAGAEMWRAGVETAAGLDVLGMVAAALWLVLVYRLPIALWFRVLAATSAFFTLVVMIVATSISNGSAAHLASVRSHGTITTADGAAAGAPRLVIGSTPHHTVTLVNSNGVATVELRSLDETVQVSRRESIVGFLNGMVVDAP